VTNERDRPLADGPADDESSSETEQDRPTVAPPFDPIAFAQEVLGGRPSPAAGTPVTKPAPAAPANATPAAGTRVPAPVPPPKRPGGEPPPIIGPVGRPTPSGLLSLANSRVPSHAPPRKESFGAFPAVDREWAELATRPPPPEFADALDEAMPSLARPHDDGDVATRPPPPMQQDLIDALARGEPPPSMREAPDLSSAAGRAALRSAPPSLPSAQEMNDRVSLGDYSGALEVAEKLLEIDPRDREALACAESCRTVLRQMYTARIGPLDRVPMVMVARDQLRWLSIDHRAGFVLSLVDGVSSVEMILDVSGMPELDALRILSELAQQRIIAFR